MAPFTKADLSKYPEIGDEIKAWKEGILLARYLAYRVGMCPANYNPDNDERFPPFDDDDDDDDGDGRRFDWFFQPASYRENILCPSKPIPETLFAFDGDDTDEDNMNAVSVEDDESLPDPRALNECTALHEIETEGQFTPTVQVPETTKTIYKSKLVQMLNDDPKLSNDRLTRVRQRSEFARKSKRIESNASTEDTVCLYTDYAIIDRLQQSFSVGQVQRIRHNGRDYIRPEPLYSPKRKDLTVVMSVYSRRDTEDTTYTTFDRSSTTLRTVPFSDIICEVLLKVGQSNSLLLESHDLSFIDSIVNNRLGKKKKRTLAGESNEETVGSTKQTEDDDGTIHLTVEPSIDVGDDVRRSSRSRKVRIFES